MRVLLALLILIAPVPAFASFEEDRADILAMAGTFRVTFDMRESTVWRPGYTPIEPKRSGGDEVVRVIEDSGRRIVLQHLLVVSHGGQSHVVKHWRQDWDYEPARVLTYAARDRWTWTAVPAGERAGAWSQTVWQVDDSPRYAGWSRFESIGGLRRWTSNPSWRPLARRDAVRKPVYDRYLGVNRHQIAPGGWIHWQDNIKTGPIAGANTPIVQEYVLNSYRRFADFDAKAADDYWAATAGFWAKVRAVWAEAAERHGGLHVRELADTGSVIAIPLMELAEQVQGKSLAETAAVAAARTLILEETARR